MLFSAIIPAYKMGRYIGEALESVASQTHQDWEIIVVDDCAPDDGTAGIVRSFATRHTNKRIEFIRHEVNTGVSGARNTAIAAAKGEFLAFLDPDDMWLPAYLATVVLELTRDPETDVVATPPIGIWEVPGKTTKPDHIQFQDWQINRFPASLCVNNFLQPSSTVVRRSRVVDLGGFDTEPSLQHIEDYDLWIRLVQSGARFSFVRENLTKYRKHPTAATRDTRRMQDLHERLAVKHSGFFISGQRDMLAFTIREIQKIRKFSKNPLKAMLGRFLGKP